MKMIRHTAQSLYSRFYWAWKQESAWADGICVTALFLWTLIDMFSGVGVTERPAFAQMGMLIPDQFVTSYTTFVTLFQFTALMSRNRPARIGANAMQGFFWASVTLSMFFLTPGELPLSSGLTAAAAIFSMLSLFRVTRVYSAGG